MKISLLTSLACDTIPILGTASDGAGQTKQVATLDARPIDEATAAILGTFSPGPTPRTYVIRGNSLCPGIEDQQEVRSFYPACSSSGRAYVLESRIVSEQTVGVCVGAGGEALVELTVSY